MHASSTRPPPPASGLARDQLFLFAAFLFVGMISVLLGPLIPELKSTWGIDHAQTGSLFLM
ncbi:MAG: hypothetical protein ACE5GX_10940 [Thermoanaerobaculia bacterium]